MVKGDVARKVVSMTILRTINDKLIGMSEASRVAFNKDIGTEAPIMMWTASQVESACTLLGLVLVPIKEQRTFVSERRFHTIESRGWILVKDGKEVIAKYKESKDAEAFVAQRRRHFVLCGE